MIKRQEGYILRKIEGIYNLLPYGQKVADQRKGITMNDTGVFLWNALEEPKEEAELTELAAEYYEITDAEEKEQMQSDIHGFINQMQALGILRTELKRQNRNCCGGMEIAGMRIGFFGNKELIPEGFKAFMVCEKADWQESLTDKKETEENVQEEKKCKKNGLKEKKQETINWDQEIEFIEYLPESRQNGQVLLRNKELIVSEWEEGYIIEFPTLDNVYEAYMMEDGSYVRIYCRQSFKESEKENLFHAIRLFFLYQAQKKGYCALHSASILYKGKAWLFSGHSGMGKSTHTAMWHEIIKTPYLNGDLNLIGIEKESGEHENGSNTTRSANEECHGRKLVVRGIPWCGTSQIYTTEDYELGGIVLLGRDSNDHVEPLSTYEKTIKVMQRMISPVWKEELLDKNLELAEEIAKSVPVLHLLCTKEPTAVETVKKEIDRLCEIKE